MGKAGRPRKAGRRDKSGKLRPIIMPDKGNDKAAAKKDRYGTDGWDAIGRAYRAGLLGDDGQVMMKAARDLFRTYWPMYEVGKIGCTLGERSGGGSYMGEKRSEDWLNRQLKKVGAVGSGRRLAFDQLVLDDHFDDGPAWLDVLLFCKRQAPNTPLPPVPLARLELALEGLRLIVYGHIDKEDLAA